MKNLIDTLVALSDGLTRKLYELDYLSLSGAENCVRAIQHNPDYLLVVELNQNAVPTTMYYIHNNNPGLARLADKLESSSVYYIHVFNSGGIQWQLKHITPSVNYVLEEIE